MEVVRVLHDAMDLARHVSPEGPDTKESPGQANDQCGRRKPLA